MEGVPTNNSENWGSGNIKTIAKQWIRSNHYQSVFFDWARQCFEANPQLASPHELSQVNARRQKWQEFFVKRINHTLTDFQFLDGIIG